MSATDIITIETDRLRVDISSRGAEMQRVNCDGLERLWCGDPAVWGRHAPLLFPLIGRLRDGYYELHGKRIDAPMHGFCRDRIFGIAEKTGTHVRFATHDDADTQRVFPFPFRLEVTYEIVGTAIEKTLVVKNIGTEPMPFEIGGHEAYATRLLPDETQDDYYVTFGAADGKSDEGIDGTRMAMFSMDDDGVLGLPKIPLPLEKGRLAQTPEQLGIDTVVLENVPDRTVTLACAKNDHRVTVEFPDFPYLGIWTKPMGADTSYLCLEPWSALPDAHFAPRELANKPGVRTVDPGKTATLFYRMTFE